MIEISETITAEDGRKLVCKYFEAKGLVQINPKSLSTDARLNRCYVTWLVLGDEETRRIFGAQTFVRTMAESRNRMAFSQSMREVGELIQKHCKEKLLRYVKTSDLAAVYCQRIGLSYETVGDYGRKVARDVIHRLLGPPPYYLREHTYYDSKARHELDKLLMISHDEVKHHDNS